MAQLTQMELQDLRHLISNHQMMVSKLNTYAQQCQDQQVKQMFQQGAQSAQSNAQKLMTFL
ncbi:hypothetical protein [Clostridium formicaceticum]|uniref:Spore coat protein n=1 Tax=Clostridium formicaceticum TaxID=1497 RepID=A0AAC9RJ50_9CLOT|nr:hypothetical protein [Clostridium formicaceticum]AOY76157.1 hypothetical protein BJL90_09735 [Clostridium formicaceticum]ARE86529.1 hypothetical protein CLFO_08510 [Clostridium formicaceticum]